MMKSMKDFMKNFDPTRRGILAGLVSTAALAATAPRAFALSEDEAKRLIDSAVGDINKVINSGKSENQMYSDFERIFWKYADVPTIARSALGPPAREASAAQIKAFTDAFAGYLSRKYGKRFRDFIGGQIEVQNSRAVKNFQEVQAVALLRGQPPFAISFMVSDRSGSDKFFDLLIEGISLLKSERSEIGAMLDKRRGDIDALVSDLQRAG